MGPILSIHGILIADINQVLVLVLSESHNIPKGGGFTGAATRLMILATVGPLVVSLHAGNPSTIPLYVLGFLACPP